MTYSLEKQWDTDHQFFLNFKKTQEDRVKQRCCLFLIPMCTEIGGRTLYDAFFHTSFPDERESWGERTEINSSKFCTKSFYNANPSSTVLIFFVLGLWKIRVLESRWSERLGWKRSCESIYTVMPPFHMWTTCGIVTFLHMKFSFHIWNGYVFTYKIPHSHVKQTDSKFHHKSWCIKHV